MSALPSAPVVEEKTPVPPTVTVVQPVRAFGSPDPIVGHEDDEEEEYEYEEEEETVTASDENVHVAAPSGGGQGRGVQPTVSAGRGDGVVPAAIPSAAPKPPPEVRSPFCVCFLKARTDRCLFSQQSCRHLFWQLPGGTMIRTHRH
jgi:hypothetical protein